MIIRYGEIALKGKNRPVFENQLVANIKDCLQKHGTEAYVRKDHSRLIVDAPYIPALRRVFGIHSISPCTICNIDSIYEAVKEHIANFSKETRFRVSVQRVDKTIKGSSAEMEREIGAYVVEQTGAKVDLKGYDEEVGIELLSGKAYVFSERIAGPGGLPVGSQGRCTVIIEDKFSELAGLLVMKRGCAIDVTKDSELLEGFAYGPGIGREQREIVVQGRFEVPAERRHELELDPLVGLTREECEEKIEWYQSLNS